MGWGVGEFQIHMGVELLIGQEFCQTVIGTGCAARKLATYIEIMYALLIFWST